MITIIQRVTTAKVTVNNQDIGKIGTGIMALVAVEKADTEKDAQRLLERILNYRIFADSDDRMNLSLRDINGGLLLIPQFTLAADTQKAIGPVLFLPRRRKKARNCSTICNSWQSKLTPMLNSVSLEPICRFRWSITGRLLLP